MAGTLPDVREIQKMVASVYDQRDWQATLADVAGASELQDGLEKLSQVDGVPGSLEGSFDSTDDVDSELTSVDAKKLELFLILLIVLPRVVPKLDAAVVADLLRWIVEVAVELSSGP